MVAGAEIAVETLRQLAAGETHPMTQPVATVLKSAPKIFKEDMLIDWSDTSEHIYNHVRGLSPYPAAFTHIGFRTSPEKEWKPCVLKIFEVEITDRKSTHKPGKILFDTEKKLLVSTQNCDISVKILQIEGKKRMKTEVFLAGFRKDNYTDFLF